MASSTTLPDDLLRLATEHYAALSAAHDGRPIGASALEVSPGGGHLAFTGVLGGDGDRQAVCVLDLADDSLAVHRDTEHDTALPAWAPDGVRLAWAVQDLDGPRVRVGNTAFEVAADHALSAGVIESLAWSPDGTRLLVGLAAPGASLSDAFGSGRIPGQAAGDASWRPLLSPQDDGEGPRHALVLDLRTGELTDALPGRTVWQACWAGADALFAIVSDQPDESAWYDAAPVLVALDSGVVDSLPRPPGQLACPVAAPGGRHLALVAGLMSDRGLDSGDLLVLERGSASWQVLGTGGADISFVRFEDDTTLACAGLRGLRTVLLGIDLTTGEHQVRWDAPETCGDPVPAFASGGGVTAVVRHGYLAPPAIAVVEDGAARVRLDLAGPRTAEVVARAGSIESLAWTSPDGTLVEGLLTRPAGAGPFPLVVEVHGGPVWSWRDGWMTGDQLTPLLVAAGYAVLHANIRGSTGRGQEFVRAGLQDMCGSRDVPDLLAGVEHLVRAGVADPDRVAVSGLSYGGLMGAWLVTTSDVFAAAVVRSPVTEWVSQHHASNLPGFDRACLSGDPLAPDSDYRTRSPLFRVHPGCPPTLLIAGGQDLATPPEQAAMFHRALRERGVASELVIYPEEGHGVHDARALVDYGARILDFLARRLPARPPT